MWFLPFGSPWYRCKWRDQTSRCQESTKNLRLHLSVTSPVLTGTPPTSTLGKWLDLAILYLMDSPQAESIAKILTSYKTWAIVGASQNSSRPSFRVLEFLAKSGYNVIPINPNYSEVDSLKCYPNLAAAAITAEIEVVDVFRRSDEAMGTTLEAVEIGAKAIWYQLGVINYEAAELAYASGLLVVIDRCPRIEIPKLKLNKEKI